MAQRLAGRFEARPMAAVNITPLVGVLLVVFAVLAVPRREAVGSSLFQPPMDCFGQCGAADPMFVSLQSDGSILFGMDKVDEAELVARLASHDPARASLNIRADAEVPYGRTFRILHRLQTMGFRPMLINEDLH